jgi:hypothetical protein
MKKQIYFSYLLFVVVVGFGIWEGKKFVFGNRDKHHRSATLHGEVERLFLL